MKRREHEQLTVQFMGCILFQVDESNKINKHSSSFHEGCLLGKA